MNDDTATVPVQRPPLGDPVPPGFARRPVRTRLDGRFVTLEPLDPATHGEALYAEVGGSAAGHLWTYMYSGPFPDRELFDRFLAQKASEDDPRFLAIADNDTALAQGFAAYMRIEPEHRSIEVGNIMYGPSLRRTRGATEAMYLMARHAFEDLGYRRYEWKCHALNASSRAAALRLGFTFEGIFRQHMIIKGRNRDTAWFSILDSEWPSRKARLERWLSQDNFDADGRQREPLSRI